MSSILQSHASRLNSLSSTNISLKNLAYSAVFGNEFGGVMSRYSGLTWCCRVGLTSSTMGASKTDDNGWGRGGGCVGVAAERRDGGRGSGVRIRRS